MRELRKISGEETIKVLQKLGFKVARQRSSHMVLKKLAKEGEIGCVVPLHRELKIGTLKGILKQAKVTSEEFVSNL
jgi:predicted RNA binding protein YcfA (HicA-like mRNA interferase family)